MSETIYWTLLEPPPALPGSADGFLSQAELRKLSLLRFPKRRAEWLLGRWAAKLLVQSLPTYQYYALEEIEIGNAPEGAPYIHPPGEGASPDCLTISHRDRAALCAVSLGAGLRIGADLETVELRPEVFSADYFTAAERSLVEACPPERRTLAVSLIWSAKESMLKALGVGLRWDTRRVEVREVEGLLASRGEWQRLTVADTQHPDRLWLAWWQRRGNFVLTLAGFAAQSDDFLTARLVEKGFSAVH